MDKRKSIADRIVALKAAMGTTDSEKLCEVKAMVNEEEQEQTESTEVGDYCPSWGEFSEWSQRR